MPAARDLIAGPARRWLRWIGSLLALLAVVLLVMQFVEHAERLGTAQWGDSLWRVLPAALGYFLCGFALAVVWWLSLRCAGAIEMSLWLAAPPLLASQLAKYLPGNVAHFAARHLLMRRYGVDHAELVAAGIIESKLLLLAAGLIGLGVLRPVVSQLLGIELPGGIELVVLGGLLVVAAASWTMARRKGWIATSLTATQAAWTWLLALIVALLFFLGMTVCFLVIAETLAWSDFARVAPWVAAAWLLGFIVPGAPGGIGIREFVLVAGLTPMIGTPSALLAAGLFRLVTIGGDALMAALGSAGLQGVWRGER